MSHPPLIYDAAYNDTLRDIDYWHLLNQEQQQFLLNFWRKDSGGRGGKEIVGDKDSIDRRNARQRDVGNRPPDHSQQTRRDSYSYTDYMARSMDEDDVIALIDLKAQLLRDYPTEESVEAKVDKERRIKQAYNKKIRRAKPVT